MPECEPHVERFEERVQRLLNEGHSVPAIAGRLHRERGFTNLADLVGAINRIKHADTADTVAGGA